jgi:hypothetical protein
VHMSSLLRVLLLCLLLATASLAAMNLAGHTHPDHTHEDLGCRLFDVEGARRNYVIVVEASWVSLIVAVLSNS